jgi:hypothetical protein
VERRENLVWDAKRAVAVRCCAARPTIGSNYTGPETARVID